MMRIWVFDAGMRKWRELENGPFPVTRDQLMAARKTFVDELKATKNRLEGAWMSPQTAARDILKKQIPTLSDFDALMLGFAVSNDRVKFGPEEK